MLVKINYGYIYGIVVCYEQTTCRVSVCSEKNDALKLTQGLKLISTRKEICFFFIKKGVVLTSVNVNSAGTNRSRRITRNTDVSYDTRTRDEVDLVWNVYGEKGIILTFKMNRRRLGVNCSHGSTRYFFWRRGRTRGYPHTHTHLCRL